MKLFIRLHLSGLSLSNTISELEKFGVQRSRKAVHDRVQKVDLQPASDASPDHIALDETVIRINGQQYWLYAAVDPETDELLYTSIETTIKIGLAETFFADLSEKHDVADAVFLIDASHSLQAARHRSGYDFRYVKYGNRDAVESIFRGPKRRIICFSNCFSNASADTADD